MLSFQGFSQNGKLNNAKESLKTTSSTTNSSSSKRSSKSSSNDDDSFFGSLIAELFIKLFSYTAYGVAIESPFEYDSSMHSAEIANYPYETKDYGNFIYTDSTNYKIIRLDIYNRFLLENKDLFGNNLGLDFRFLKRFSLNADFTSFSENVSGKRDNFTMYSAILKYHRIRTQRFDAWFGLGATHVANSVNETGFTFGVGGEWFIKKPISLLFSHQTTSINAERVNNTKLLLKYHIKHYRISTGYEHYRLGVSKINTFSLGIEVSF
ncbi:hypothetical protein BTO18_13780 [Polaribacter porphyrae]|uniref:Outer membrane protein beta-barrel domain-containing protein n=2 Tax=Polaribacter porphyrae TaxID=1137780 RepID=A0A2S7WRF5_9FLAO|nr:hypothetical protein BTO18_13780 [Polaribacter porphyrae]